MDLLDKVAKEGAPCNKVPLAPLLFKLSLPDLDGYINKELRMDLMFVNEKGVPGKREPIPQIIDTATNF